MKSGHGKLIASIVIALPMAAWSAPSVKIGTAAFIAPGAANDLYYPTTTLPPTKSLATTGRPNEIVELARALGNNVDLVYDFVRNNIDTVWMYGLQKGALGAMTDRSGTPFDQAHLMVELLRQAGYAAEYKVGTITLSGAQFSAWTGITSATAACQLLASGGIPGAINGSTIANCGYGSAAVSSVELGHIWVSVTMPGGPFLFDPSYKPYTIKPPINLAAAAQLNSGEALTQAGIGMVPGSTPVGFVSHLNGSALNAKLQFYGNNVLAYIKANFPAGEIDEIVGGRKLVRFVGNPVLRQTALPYSPAPTVHRTWSGDIPDAYRTSLRVQVTKADLNGQYPTIFDYILYVDEIYGRKLILHTDFGFNTALKVVDESGAGVTVATHTDGLNAGYMVGTVTLTASHPYAAAADGSTALTGDYMDVTVAKEARYTTPLTIVHGWGDTARGLVDKWGSRVDSALPSMPSPGGCEMCGSAYFASKGDGRREQLAASWLAQSSRAARLHANIGNSIYSLHHSIGIVSANSTFRTINIYDDEPGAPPMYAHTVVDSFDRIDVDSAFSLTSKTANATDRRAAIHAIAATTEALEGSVAAQISDLPDTASTSTRFEWGNQPPVSEDPSAGPSASIGPRRFYQFNSGNHSQASALIRVEGQSAPIDDGVHNWNVPDIGSGEFSTRRNALQLAISTYAQAGFDVVASEEAFLGPGQRAGAFNQVGDTTLYTHAYTQQRGGALVATRYVGGDPVEIAHVVIGPTESSKGGGGGAQPIHQAQYDPSQAADILKARFVDRSKALGVDLQSGALTYASPASLTVGNGGFPYSLTANLLWVGGVRRTNSFGPESHVEPQGPWTTNWNNTLTVSGSGMEAMGDGDVRATAGTIAAFLAAQDVYKAAPSTQRDVAGVLVNAWWVRQLTGNVVTANVATDTRQFVKLVDNTWTLTGPGAFATLTQNGSRTIHTEKCSGPPYVLTRGWNYAGMSYQVTNANGDVQTFSYWSSRYQDSSSQFCALQHGFRLSSWTFPFGVTVSLDYAEPYPGESLPELTQVRNSLGRKIVFVESGRGGFNNGLTGADLRTVTVQRPQILWDGDATHTDPSGAVTQFVAELAGNRYLLKQVFAADNPSQPSVQYDYDTLWRVKEARDAVTLQVGGRNPYQFFIADGARGERLDPAGGRYSVFYDDRRRPFGYMDELGRTTSVETDGRGRVKRYIYPELDEERFEYDDHNNPSLLTKIAKPGSALANLTIQAQWNQTWNKPDWVRDARGNVTSFAYYPSGNGRSLIQTATRPPAKTGDAQPLYQFTYNALGKLATTTDPTGVVVTNEYDAGNGNNLLSTRINALNNISVYAHDAIGNVTSITDPRNYVAEFKYDNNRRKTHTLHHDGGIAAPVVAAERANYDVLGRVQSEGAGTVFSGTNVTAWQRLRTLTYTKTSKVYTEENGAGNKTLYTYDPMDRLYRVEDPVGRRRRFEYDPAGQLLKEIRAEGAAIQHDYASYTYTPNGLRRTIKDGNGNLSTFEYDGFDRLRRWRFPLATLGASASCNPQTQSLGCYEEYDYDENGNRRSVRKRDGQVIGYNHDALNRETWKDLPPAGPSSSDVYSDYDLAGRPMWKRLGSTTGPGVDYGYDAARRLQSETSFGRTLAFQYDLNSNRTRIAYPDTNYVSYEYDALNRLTYVRENGAASGVGVLARYQYDPLSRRDTLTRGNGTLTDYDYDAASRLTRLAQDLPGTSYDAALGFGYTLASQLRSRTTNNDALGWWTDPIQVRNYARNGLNQYTSVNGTTHGYDWNGNLTSDGLRTFTYDPENRLSTVSGSASMTLTYDPLGRLRQTVSGGATTQYLYEGDRLTAEYDGSGNLLRRYVHGAGIDEPIVWYEGSGLTDRRWLHTDERGSVIAHSDGAGGVAPYVYGTYGEQATWTGSRFSYTGQAKLTEVKLYHYKARVYDPELGRFLQTDPVGYDDDFNLYAYVKNDPLNLTDPTGTDAACAYITGCNIVVTEEGARTVGGMLPGAGYVEAVNDAAAGKYAAAGLGVAMEAGGGKYLKAAGQLLGKLGKAFGEKVTQSVKNFLKNNPIPTNTGNIDARNLPSDGVAVQATKAGDVPGSKAVYEKQIDADGSTVQSTKTTYDPRGNIVHVKDKLSGETFTPCKKDGNSPC